MRQLGVSRHQCAMHAYVIEVTHILGRICRGILWSYSGLALDPRLTRIFLWHVCVREPGLVLNTLNRIRPLA